MSTTSTTSTVSNVSSTSNVTKHNYKIISDLHLGIKGDVSNNFLLNEHVFEKYLLTAVDQYDAIILNGDTFELWEDMISVNVKSLETRIMNRLNNILNSWCFGQLLAEHPSIWIISGNHDSLIKNEQFLPKKKPVDHIILSNEKYRLYVAHGHQGDIFCSDNSWISCLSCFASQIKSTIEDMVDDNLDQNVEKLRDCIDTNDDKITKYALQLCNIGNYDAVIFGHTHNKLLTILKEKIYVNDGSASDRREIIDECNVHLSDTLQISNITINLVTNEILSTQSNHK